jgi:hypothetical protein
MSEEMFAVWCYNCFNTESFTIAGMYRIDGMVYVFWVSGAMILFLAVLVVYAEGKIALNDFPRCTAAFFGVAANILTF